VDLGVNRVSDAVPSSFQLMNLCRAPTIDNNCKLWVLHFKGSLAAPFVGFNLLPFVAATPPVRPSALPPPAAALPQQVCCEQFN